MTSTNFNGSIDRARMEKCVTHGLKKKLVLSQKN